LEFWRWRNFNPKNPTYNYIDTGYFKITLIVSVNSCKDTLEIDRYIYINPPVAKFLKEFDCLIPLQRTFVDKSIAPLTHVWDFGDGATSTDASPVHIYAAAGIYPVSLTVTNGACTHTAKDTLIVVSSNPNFTVSGASFCKFADVVFTVNNINPAHIANYSWDFGDGNTRIGSGILLRINILHLVTLHPN
jgi:PKD repeat protein